MTAPGPARPAEGPEGCHPPGCQRALLHHRSVLAPAARPDTEPAALPAPTRRSAAFSETASTVGLLDHRAGVEPGALWGPQAQMEPGDPALAQPPARLSSRAGLGLPGDLELGLRSLCCPGPLLAGRVDSLSFSPEPASSLC